MRKIISQGSNTVMEGVFSSPFVSPNLKDRKPRRENPNRVRKARRLQHRKKCFAVLMVLAAWTPVFAASPAETSSQGPRAVQRSESVFSAGSSEVVKRPRYGSQKSAKSDRVNTGRVQLDDYQKVPEAVTRKRSTEAVWLGQKNKSN